MKARATSTARQVIVTTLLLLAVSPVTAPFLTYDIQDLLGDSSSHSAGLVQPKTTHDQPVAALGLQLAALAVPVAYVDAPSSGTPQVRGNRPPHVPLRV